MEQNQITTNQTIVAISTPPGTGGIAVIRISGPDAIKIADKAWRGKRLYDLKPRSASLGNIIWEDGKTLDQAVATVFRAPASFTGEDVVELSVHGSRWIQKEVIALLIRHGARTAEPGEFTQRAFLNNRIDLAQAEGVADLIASSSKAAHRLAIAQTQGLFSNELDSLRTKLIEFASLLELELDFSEEDVEFADRANLLQLSETILNKIRRLANTFSTGNALKEGIPVVIAGIPNAGKSSLLNLMLGTDKAIVTNVPGTTRDIIEDTAEINGILYRFADTAGLRETSDIVETIGIDRAMKKMQHAAIIIWIIDPSAPIPQQLKKINDFKTSNPDSKIIALVNKSDLFPSSSQTIVEEAISISAKTGAGYSQLIETLHRLATEEISEDTDIIVTNARHFEALTQGAKSLERATEAIKAGISADFIAMDIREALHHLSSITGAVTTPDLLTSIFSRFCIGK